MEIMYYNNAENNNIKLRKFTGFIGLLTDLQAIIPKIEVPKIRENKKVKKLIKKKDNNAKIFEFSNEIYKKRYNELSKGEKKLVTLVHLCNQNPSTIILNHFDIGFNAKIKSRISRYIKTINATKNTNFIIISNDVFFINKNVKHIIIAKNKIIKYQGDILTAIKQKYINEPEIFKFIDLANEKGANIDYTLDSKELLKSIYRSVF